MKKLSTVLSGLGLALALVACSESSAGEKTVQEAQQAAQQEAEGMDAADIEAKIKELQDMIASKTKEISEVAGDVMDKGMDAASGGMEGLKEKGTEMLDSDVGADLKAQLESLKAQLEVYTKELTKKK